MQGEALYIYRQDSGVHINVRQGRNPDTSPHPTPAGRVTWPLEPLVPWLSRLLDPPEGLIPCDIAEEASAGNHTGDNLPHAWRIPSEWHRNPKCLLCLICSSNVDSAVITWLPYVSSISTGYTHTN